MKIKFLMLTLILSQFANASDVNADDLLEKENKQNVRGINEMSDEEIERELKILQSYLDERNSNKACGDALSGNVSTQPSAKTWCQFFTNLPGTFLGNCKYYYNAMMEYLFLFADTAKKKSK